MKTIVIIPTHNESSNISALISAIRRQGIDTVVIDDGSTDDTFRIASQSRSIVLQNDHNIGKGASLIKGFEFAISKGYDTVITMDGDGQHLPQDIPTFLEAARLKKTGVIIGNRMQSVANMPKIRVLTNSFMSWVISCITKQHIPDSQCGFRLIKKEVLQRIKLRTKNFEIESEMLIEAGRAGFTITSVPIKTIYNNERSHIHPVRDTIRFFKYLFERTKWITGR
ncbi:MAG: glycosyltransferase family 2 protein [Candidatus Omnitrophota bacterium]